MSTILFASNLYNLQKNEVSANMNQGRLIYHNYYITICKNKKKIRIYWCYFACRLYRNQPREVYQVATISGMEISVAFCKLIDVWIEY